jgi:hypothetical protein
MNIEMQEITPEYLPAESGTYLVRSLTSHAKKFIYTQARVSKHYDEKNKKWKYSIDVSGQTPTHISTEPLQ